MISVPYNVCLIAEGNEEYEFFQSMKEAKAVNAKFSLEIILAGGFGRVGSLFQEYRVGDLFDCVVCVYDVDYRQNELGSPFNQTRSDLKEILGETEAVDAVSFCTNPNFLQIYLLSRKKLAEVRLLETSKNANTKFVRSCWPAIAKPKVNLHGQDSTKNYVAAKWQLQIMNATLMEDVENYRKLLANAAELPNSYLEETCPGSNVPELIRALLDGDVGYFESINNILDKKEGEEIC